MIRPMQERHSITGAGPVLAAACMAIMGSFNHAAAGDDCTYETIAEFGLNNDGTAVSSITSYDGQPVIGGTFSIKDGEPADRIARWDGSAWQPIGTGMSDGFNPLVSALTVYDGDLIAGGRFESAGGQTVNNIARWDGSSWQPLGEGVDWLVNALIEYEGDLIVGGWFENAGGETVNRIARWDGSAWHDLNGGVTGGNGTTSIDDMVIYNGDLFVGGTFDTAGGTSANFIARWDGSNWHSVAGGMDNSVRALEVFDGDLYAAGFFATAGGQGSTWGIARFDGKDWHDLGGSQGGGLLGSVAGQTLTVYNDALIVGGNFTNVFFNGNSNDIIRLARWDGESWDGLVDACPGSVQSGCGANNWVEALHVHDGRLFIGGTFNVIFGEFINHVVAWDEDCPDAGVPGDLNDDELVDVSDLLILLGNWGTAGAGADLAKPNDVVDVSDLLLLLDAWTG